jgi:type IV secretory pathway VirB2 component (pilin)
MTRRGISSLPIVAALALRPAVTLAAATGGGTMPWDTPLQTLRTDLTGATATSISFIGMALLQTEDRVV